MKIESLVLPEDILFLQQKEAFSIVLKSCSLGLVHFAILASTSGRVVSFLALTQLP